jgi:orotidine-5'-phosphate decarboxylase
MFIFVLRDYLTYQKVCFWSTHKLDKPPSNWEDRRTKGKEKYQLLFTKKGECYMSTRGSFSDLFTAMMAKGRHLCVGLDSDKTKLPPSILLGWGIAEAMYQFNAQIIDATIHVAGAYKINSAFYEDVGPEGMATLIRTIAHIHEKDRDVVVFLDFKRGDIGNTNFGYVRSAFDLARADAVTVHNYMGMVAMKPFLDRADKGIFVLCRTTGEGSGEFQDLDVRRSKVQMAELLGGDTNVAIEAAIHGWGGPELYHLPLYQYVALRVKNFWDANGNCGLVAGATSPRELLRIRTLVGAKMPILIPGVGEQGGNLAKSVTAACACDSRAFYVNDSRKLIFASSGEDFAYAAGVRAESVHNQILNAVEHPAESID